MNEMHGTHQQPVPSNRICLSDFKTIRPYSCAVPLRLLAVLFVSLILPVSAANAAPPEFTVHTTKHADGDLSSNPQVGKQVASSVNSVSGNRALSRREVLLASLTIFVLAIFVGFEVITKVPPTLHTPLMSGSNAISGITIVGALIAAGAQRSGFASVLGLLAVILATINVVGGFMVTHRMLGMFQKKN